MLYVTKEVFIDIKPNIDKIVLYKDLPYILKFKLDSNNHLPDDKFIIRKHIKKGSRVGKKVSSYSLEKVN
jgi:hypothetical protein